MISLICHQTSEVVKVVALVTSQQALDGEEDGADVIECWPLVLQDVQTDESLFIHIRMETGSDKLNTRSLVWITSRKLQGQPVPETLIHLRHTDTWVNKPCYYWSSHLYNILIIYLSQPCGERTVPWAPSMVPTHLKRLSDSGKAEIPLSPDICNVREQQVVMAEMLIHITQRCPADQHQHFWFNT